MGKYKQTYQAFDCEITIDDAIKAAGVSRSAFYAQLSKLGGEHGDGAQDVRSALWRRAGKNRGT